MSEGPKQPRASAKAALRHHPAPAMEGTVLWLVGARRRPHTRVRALRTEPPHHNVNVRARALLPVRQEVRSSRF